ncbi:MAG TPA: Stk1 family PASTA domain-containing Ser/Thr kinase [Micromonosporaceae bacterium]
MDTKVVDPLLGALIAGRYRIRARVARGGMATVYMAADERLERTVAVKMIEPGHVNDARFLRKFAEEATTIARLTHPNVVAVYDQGTHEGLPFLVMEFVRGTTLRELLSERRRLEPEEALAVLEQMLAAIGAAHRAGLVHRDIKPENVLVAQAPNGANLLDAVVKVADFGLARAIEAADDTNGGQLMATVAYVAPELVTDGRADPRTDVYSTGIVLFEMLTGRVPYLADKPIEVAWQHVDRDVPPPSTYVPGLPRVVDDLVGEATRRDPARRPTDAAALLALVQAARDALSTERRGSGGVVAQPTVIVSPVSGGATVAMSPVSGGGVISPVSGGAGPGAAERPSWARLPGRYDEPRQAGRRRAVQQPTGARLGERAAQLWYRLRSHPQNRYAMIAAMVVAALVVVLGGWWFAAGRYTDTPSLLAMNRADAVRLAEQKGLHVRFDKGRYDDKAAKDTVVDQDPRAGEKIVGGGTITLTLSLGPERYTVPDVVGQAYDVAVNELEKIKATPVRTDKYDDNMPVGNVLSTSPPAGQPVPPGAQVTVVVSKGRAPITVPSVIGQDVNAATQALQGLGLKVAVIQQDSDKPANQVIAQDPAQGSGVENGATVTLTISKGPPGVPVPDLTNMDPNQAQQALAAAGLQLKPVINLGGHVHQQSPAPNTVVPPGTEIQVWIYPP